MGIRKTIANLVSPPEPPKAMTFGLATGGSKITTGKIAVDSRAPISKRVTPEIPRVDKSELEGCYLREPTTFNSINKTAQIIMAAGYKLIGDDESVSFFQEFFDEIGLRGGELEWEELLNSIFRHQMIYGEAWNELILSKRDKGKIVDLSLIDPKRMDYAKDSSEKIVLDVHGNPLGYTETLPYDYTIESKIQPPKEVTLSLNQLFFPPDRLVHYKLYTMGDAFYGVGLIEPAYLAILRKTNLERAHANAVDKNGFPVKKVKIGDDNHEPTEEMIERTIEKIKNANYREVFAFPHWMDIEFLEAKSPEKLNEHLVYYTDQIVTSMGLPRALATGAGEQTNRATLNRQEAVTKLTLKDIVRRTLRIMNKKIIAPVAKSNNVSPVKIVWGEMSVEELDGKAKRLTSYVKAGLLMPDLEIEALLRKYEDLPRRNKNATNRPRVGTSKPRTRQEGQKP